MKSGKLHIGVGGWTYRPWRGLFYPAGLPHRQELEFASRRLGSIEINGTYYSTFKPATWRKWREATPSNFVFAVKGSRFCTNRKDLSTAGEAVERFINQGLAELGDRLGPVAWQFAATKAFDPEEMAAFLALLPRELAGRKLHHALEVRHPSFAATQFYDLARRHGVAIVVADHDRFPHIEQRTADFTYARLMRSRAKVKTGYPAGELDAWSKQMKTWARRGDAYVYVIAGAKERAPAAAEALIARCAPVAGRRTAMYESPRGNAKG